MSVSLLSCVDSASFIELHNDSPHLLSFDHLKICFIFPDFLVLYEWN